MYRKLGSSALMYSTHKHFQSNEASQRPFPSHIPSTGSCSDMLRLSEQEACQLRETALAVRFASQWSLIVTGNYANKQCRGLRHEWPYVADHSDQNVSSYDEALCQCSGDDIIRRRGMRYELSHVCDHSANDLKCRWNMHLTV